MSVTTFFFIMANCNNKMYTCNVLPFGGKPIQDVCHIKTSLENTKCNLSVNFTVNELKFPFVLELSLGKFQTRLSFNDFNKKEKLFKPNCAPFECHYHSRLLVGYLVLFSLQKEAHIYC